jgi:hypothetical protein
VTSVEVKPLEIQARQVLSRVRSAFGSVLQALPERPDRPSEVQKALKIDAKLGWSISKLIKENDLYLSAQHVPGERRLETFFKAAKRRDVPEPLLERARKSVEEFDALIEIHAGDRASLEMMLLGCSARTDHDAVIALRREAFRASSFIWGVQAKTQFGMYIMRRSDDPSWGDLAGVRGFIGLRRMRPNVPWVVSRLRAADEEGQELSSFTRMPLVDIDDHADDGTPPTLMRQFCSTPAPEISRVTYSAGFFEEVLAPTGVGDTGAIDVVTGDDSLRVVPRHQMEGETVWGGLRMLRTPTETLILDQLIHEDLFGPIEPRLIQLSDLNLSRGLPSPPVRESDIIETGEVVQYLGKDPTAIYTPEIPRYADIVAYTCNRIGIDPAKLDVYRVRVDYPIIPTSIGMEHDLPEQPYGD